MSQFRLTCPYRSAYEGTHPKWLFVCSAGQLRSPTAAVVAQQELAVNARSCGTERFSLIPISVNLLHWCDRVVFMDHTCYDQAHELYSRVGMSNYLESKLPEVWDIPDAYPYMDQELVGLIKKKLKSNQ